ncbi:TolC family protein [Acidovorax sp. YS12]|jgi:cobalt-zinc-cadmium efflux system outer membrane protein|nr:TolC family protein [Acidovorax sp. YS12]
MHFVFLPSRRTLALRLALAGLGVAGATAALAAAAAPPAGAPAVPAVLASARPQLRFVDYLQAVEAHSLDLQAQQTTVTAARAGVGIAGLRPDPELSLGWSREQVRTGVPRPSSYNPAISWELETGGKRAARIREATSHVRLAEAQVEGFRHGLFNDSASAFAEVCRTREVLARKQQTLQALDDVVRANEVRRKAGDVGGVELLQSRVERDQFAADVTQARADAQAALVALSVPLGRRVGEVLGDGPLDCDFAPFTAGDDLQALLPAAMQARDDIQIAEATLNNARDKASLAQANRWVNPTLSVGVTNTAGYPAGTGRDGEPYDAASRSRTLAVSVSVPLPLSRLDKGDLVQAEAEVTQAMLGLEQARHRAEADVRAARFRFVAARDNVARYRDGVLADAQKVLEGMRLSYRHGAASLLELLVAQRSADDAYLAYLQARADLATATVQLQLSVGQRPAL